MIIGRELTILPSTGGQVAAYDDEEPDSIMESFTYVRAGNLKEIRFAHLSEHVALQLHKLQS